MADYTPKISGWSDTRTTSAAVVGGELLVVSGDDTVAKSAGADESWYGVAAFDAASGEEVTVEHGGVQGLTADGAITAGDPVISSSDGKVATIGAETDYSRVVGVARNTVSDAETVFVAMAR